MWQYITYSTAHNNLEGPGWELTLLEINIKNTGLTSTKGLRTFLTFKAKTTCIGVSAGYCQRPIAGWWSLGCPVSDQSGAEEPSCSAPVGWGQGDWQLLTGACPFLLECSNKTVWATRQSSCSENNVIILLITCIFKQDLVYLVNLTLTLS